MEKYYIILFLFILGNKFCDAETYEDKCSDVEKNKAKECFSLLQEEEKEYGYDCCLVKYKSNDGKAYSFCNLIESEDMDDYITGLKDSGNEDVFVTCRSNYNDDDDSSDTTNITKNDSNKSSQTTFLKNCVHFNLILLILILL